MSEASIVLTVAAQDAEMILKCMNVALKAEADALTASQHITPVAMKISAQVNEQLSEKEKQADKKPQAEPADKKKK